MKHIITFLCVFISACSAMSVKEVRDSHPYKTGTFKAEYSELGNCVLDALMSAQTSTWSQSTGNLQYETVNRSKASTMTITGSAVTHFKVPLIDLTVSGAGQSSTVDLRLGGMQNGPRGVVESLGDDAWSFVEQCAK